MGLLTRALLTVALIVASNVVTAALPQSGQTAAGVVDGRVIDAGSSEALPGAKIAVVGGGAEASSDRDGRFRLSLPPGEHKLLVTYLGRQDQVIDVKVTSRGVSRLDVTMSVAAFEENLTVTAPALILESAGTRPEPAEDRAEHHECRIRGSDRRVSGSQRRRDDAAACPGCRSRRIRAKAAT